MSKQYNKNVGGVPNVVVGTPCEAKTEVVPDETIKIQHFEITPASGVQQGTTFQRGALITFRLPQPNDGYKILSVNYTIRGGDRNPAYFSQSDMFKEGTVNLPTVSDLDDIIRRGILTNLTNNNAPITIVSGVRNVNNNTDVLMYAYNFIRDPNTRVFVPGNWDFTERYVLRGFYVLEKTAERERRDIEEEPNPNRSY